MAVKYICRSMLCGVKYNAVVVAQLAERLLPIPDISSSNPVNGKILCFKYFAVNCWQSGCFRYQISAVRIQSSARFYISNILLLTVEKSKIKKERPPGLAHF